MITTIVGNYPKLSSRSDGPNLRRAITQFDSGRIGQEELAQVVREVTSEVIQEQEEAGLDLLTDGQIAWDDGQTPFAKGMKGFEINGLIRYFDTNTYFRQPIPNKKVEWQSPICLEWFRYAQARSSKPVKTIITGPYTLGKLAQVGQYSGLSALVMDLAQALNREALELQDAGAPFIQFDEPAILSNKGDIGLLQQASEIVTRGLTAKTGICTYFGDISGIQREFFQLPYQVFGLDFVMGKDNYELIQHLPSHRELAAGIMDARNTRMESVEEIVECIRKISGYVPLDRLYVCPSAGLEYLPRTTAREKLVRLVEGAKRAQEVLA